MKDGDPTDLRHQQVTALLREISSRLATLVDEMRIMGERFNSSVITIKAQDSTNNCRHTYLDGVCVACMCRQEAP